MAGESRSSDVSARRDAGLPHLSALRSDDEHGAKGLRVERPAGIRRALDQAFSADRPCVAEVMTDQEAVAPLAYVGD